MIDSLNLRNLSPVRRVLVLRRIFLSRTPECQKRHFHQQKFTGQMDIQPGKVINCILVIGISFAALFLGTTAFSWNPKPINQKIFPLRKSRSKRSLSTTELNVRNKIASWDPQLSIAVPEIPSDPCGRSLTVQDIASSFHSALYNTTNRNLVKKAFKSLPLLLIYNGRRSEYISKMRIVLISYFMNLFDSTIFNPNLCVEACKAMQMLTTLQSGPLAHNYNGMLEGAGAIETLTDVLRIHMPTADDYFMDISLVAWNMPKVDENIKRHVFEYLYSPEENALVAELGCSVLGRLCRSNAPSRDYVPVLDGIIFALAAHWKHVDVTLEAFTAIFNCRLVHFATQISERSCTSLFDSVTKVFTAHRAHEQIITMGCQIINDLLNRKFRARTLDICEPIISCMSDYKATRNIHGGVFDILSETAIKLSESNDMLKEKFVSMKVRKLIGDYDSSLSPERISELYLFQIKFSNYC